MNHIQYREKALPVLREADVVVGGGSLAGIAAALELAKGGSSVAIIEPRTYLGRDITATLRPWLRLDETSTPTSLPEPIRTILTAQDRATTGGGAELPLHPDTVKRCLEDALLQANVGLLYASLPIDRGQAEGGKTSLVIGNKSGRQVVRCDTIIDTTETALLARLAGGTFATPREGTARFRRTLGFDRLPPLEHAELAVPEWLGVVNNRVHLHHGYRGSGHLLIEIELDLPYSADVEGAGYVEWEARRRSMSLASHLVSEYPKFREAGYAGSAHELHGRWTSSLAGSVSEWCGPFDGAAIHLADAAGPVLDLPLLRFAGPAPNLWCLNEASRLDAGQAALFLDPIRASRLGANFAATMLETWHARHESTTTRPITGGTELAGADTTIEVREPVSPQRGRVYRRLTVPSTAIPIHRTVDVLVAGGGSSGATAAITAGREGMRTLLLDMNPGPGGTGTYGGVDSYWYGRHAGFAGRLEQRVGALHACLNHTGAKWNIDAKTDALLESAQEAGVETLFNTLAIGALVSGDRVRGVAVASRWGPFAEHGEVVIDATGDGDIAAFAGAAFTYGAERTHSVMWYSLAQYAAPGLIHNNFTSTVDVSNIEDYTRAILAGRRRGDSTHDHGVYVATRENRHIRGGVTMTLTDQLRHRRWPDVVNIQYSNHDIKGQTESEWLRSGLIPPNLEVEIPYRLLAPAGLDGILVSGKAISVTHDGLPAVRMQADLENLGGVVGLAAAQAVREGTAARDIDLPRLQQRLVDEGLLPQDMLARDIEEREYSDTELEAFVEALTGEIPLYTYSDMHMGKLFHECIPFVELCRAGEGAVPPLERAPAGCCWPRCSRSAALAPVCQPWSRRSSARSRMANFRRDSNIRHAGFPPDQGAMPDVAYLLFSLGLTPDPRCLPVWTRVAGLLDPTAENLRDRFSGTFHYVDAICQAADQSGDSAMIPLLQHLRTHPTLRDQVCREGFQPDFFEERQAMLELGIARGLARCGSPEGYDILVGYLNDARVARRTRPQRTDRPDRRGSRQGRRRLDRLALRPPAETGHTGDARWMAPRVVRFGVSRHLTRHCVFEPHRHPRELLESRSMTANDVPFVRSWAAVLPWTEGTGRPWRGCKRLPAMMPFTIVYILIAWVVFIPAAERRGRHYWIDDDAVGHLLFQIPNLTGDPLQAILSIVTGPWINHDSLQLMYVTALLLIFGAVFEVREGTLRMVIVFFGTSFVAALFSGFLLHLIYPHVWDTRFFEVAWNRNWTGGSAGCFGLLGAFAARARRPGLLLALFVAWECFIWWVNLRNYTSVFHFSAMATGFVATRLFLPPVQREQR